MGQGIPEQHPSSATVFLFGRSTKYGFLKIRATGGSTIQSLSRIQRLCNMARLSIILTVAQMMNHEQQQSADLLTDCSTGLQVRTHLLHPETCGPAGKYLGDVEAYNNFQRHYEIDLRYMIP